MALEPATAFGQVPRINPLHALGSYCRLQVYNLEDKWAAIGSPASPSAAHARLPSSNKDGR